MLIETVAAILVLTIGVLGMIVGFDAARRLSLVSERHSAMALVAQREIERIQGINYAGIGLTSPPATSSDSTNPDYYVVGGSPESYQYSHTNGVSEMLVVDTMNGQVTPVQSWSQGNLSGSIYDFVSYVSDPNCSPGCPASQNYKRITVAVTIGGGLQPTPVYSSSVIADPAAMPAGGISNGNAGNPLTDPGTTCKNAQAMTVPCYSPIDSGNPNTFYLHDSSATGGAPGTINADNVTHPTVGVLSGLLCTAVPFVLPILSSLLGCPVPDAMDNNPPTGVTSQPLYHYSTDQASNATYPGGRLLQPTCSGTSTCGGSQGATCTGSGCGTGSPSDCSGGNWVANLLSAQTGFWVSSPVTASLTLTGDGGLSMYTQAVGGASAVVSFCIEIYDVPPSGSAGSLADLLAWPPIASGGAGYVPATDPATGGNWPTTASGMAYTFNFRGSNGTVAIAAGDRIGVRIWAKANLNTAVALLYDNPRYPTSIQLNTQ
jgi:hypothetical protein